MGFSIECRTFVRIANAALQPDEPDRTPPYPTLRSVRLESYHGRQIVIASNRLVMAIEHLSDNGSQIDEAINVSLDLVGPCAEAAKSDGVLTVNQVAANYAVATISTGYFHAGNAMVEGAYPDWRALIPKSVPKKPIGSIAIHAPGLVALAKSAPSGHLVFPTSFDASQPIFVTDNDDPDFVGAFLALDHRDQSEIEPASIPEWLK